MYIFKVEQRFNPRNGKPAGFEKVRNGTICDYTGHVIDEDDYQQNPLYVVKFKYDSGSEQDWYYDDVSEIIKLITGSEENEEIDDFQLRARLSEGDFHYRWCQDTMCDTSIALLRDWWKGFEKKGNLFYQCGSLGLAARKQRMKVVAQLLKDKKFTAKELGLVDTDGTEGDEE